MGHALIVDNDTHAAGALATLVAAEDFTVATARSLRDARRQIALQSPDVVLLDARLPDGNGAELFDDPSLLGRSQVVVMTDTGAPMSQPPGAAADQVAKPVGLPQLRKVLARVMRPTPTDGDRALETDWQRSGRFGHLWGRSAPMQRVFRQIGRVAGTTVSVLITGESGTGKELVARTLHDLSRRRRQPFLAVNCGALSPNLIESEVFGHEKGSFTGADRQHPGFFERTHGGTLFLDEITEMPAALQVKLLRVLETGTYLRVGSTHQLSADVRVVAATNRDPGQAVADGLLREDLLYRLNVFPIALPPLRDRLDDLPLLATHLLAEVAAREGTPARQLSAAALQRLAAHSWPGNVRELRNAIQRACVMSDGDEIGDEWLPQGVPPAEAPPPCAAGDTLSLRLGTTLAEVERQFTLATLQRHGHRRESAAAALGISARTLGNRLRAWGETD